MYPLLTIPGDVFFTTDRHKPFTSAMAFPAWALMLT